MASHFVPFYLELGMLKQTKLAQSNIIEMTTNYLRTCSEICLSENKLRRIPVLRAAFEAETLISVLRC